MNQSPYYTQDELADLGLGMVGRGVQLSRRSSLHGAANIHLASHVRIDDSCVITASADGVVRMGDHVHIGAHSVIIGRGGVCFEDYSGVSPFCCILSASDDFSGEWMSNPTIPDDLTGVTLAPVRLERHALVGAHCVILPGVTIGEGSAVGAMSLIKTSLEPWGIYAGTPARRVGERSRRLLELARELLEREREPGA